LERCRSGGWNGFVRVRHFCFGTKFLLVLTVLSLISLLQITVQSKGQLLFSFSNRAFRFRWHRIDTDGKICQFFHFILFSKKKYHALTETVWYLSFLVFYFIFWEFYVKNLLYLFNN
jgi:hypothetical protein